VCSAGLAPTLVMPIEALDPRPEIPEVVTTTQLRLAR
jgi:hypothetical protein